jgi:AraC family ethanolamine operon transcriptional activator
MNISDFRRPRQIKIQDIDQLCEALQGWESEPVQLTKGPLDLVLTTAGVGGCSLLQVSAGPRIADQSVVHAGTIGFVLVERPQIWCGMQIEPPTLLVMSTGREMRSVLAPNFRSLEFYFEEKDVAAHPLGRLLRRSSRDPERSVIPLNDRSANQLRTVADAVYAGCDIPVDGRGAVAFQDALQRRILDLLERIISPHFETALRQKQEPRRPLSARLAVTALEQIERNRQETISVSALCAHLGVSRRALELAFANLLGVSPGQYLLAYRLNLARNILATKGGRVADSAEIGGFQDGSRFAFQYRRLFGELPSETLERRRERLAKR